MNKIKIPPVNEDFVEFLGICFGDGCLSVNLYKHDYFLQIVANSIDELKYLKFVSFLIEKLFGLKIIIRKQITNTIILSKRSKQLIELLNEYGMPIGKKYKLHVPKCVLISNKLSLAFIRGLFDTDGSLTFKRTCYPAISITSRCKELLIEVRKILLKNSFKLGKVVEEYAILNNKKFIKYRIFIYGIYNLDRWFSIIGSNNPKNIKKYKIWKRYWSYKDKSRLRDLRLFSHPQPLPNFIGDYRATAKQQAQQCSPLARRRKT
jgi:intein/homing endonuclease